MKNSIISKIQILIVILTTSIAFSSCSFTHKTGTANNFSKKHYNKGILTSHKKKDDHKNIAINSLNRKEVKAELKATLPILEQSKELSATLNEDLVNDNSENIQSGLINKLLESKETILQAKAEASTDKEIKKADKALGKLERFEKTLNKIAPKVAENAALSASPDYGGRSSDEKRGLAALILGAVGLFFGFLALNIAAIILGTKADQGGSTLGKIGKILGWVGLGIFLFALLIFVLVAI